MDLDDVVITVEGLGCDMDANGDAWGVLELPGLGFADGWEVQRAASAGCELDFSRIGLGGAGRGRSMADDNTIVEVYRL